jgi:hypothetical protein
MNTASKAETKLRNVCDRLGITREGHAWLDHAVDPFKDLLKPHAGYVDKTTNPSVVEVVKQTVAITAPGAGNWDCNIFLDQVLQSISQYSTTTSGATAYILAGQGATPYTRGGLVVRKAASGTSLDTTTTDNPSCMQVGSGFYANEDSRVIAIGFEVHDTTQELKKQGNVVVYRLDQPVERSVPKTMVQDAGVTACIPTTVESVQLLQPPLLSSEALDVLGSQQWEAKEGVYVVPVLVQDTNPPLPYRDGLVAHSNDGAATYFPLITSTGASRLIATTAKTVSNPWSFSGAFFAGLDPAAVLTVNFNYLIERFPNKNSAIKRLCYPSPAFDSTALELYSKIASDFSTGVPVRENGLGDWLAGIANLASGALSLIPHPLAKMASAGLTALGNNRQVQQGVKQIANQVEKKVEAKLERSFHQPSGKELVVYVPPKERSQSAILLPGPVLQHPTVANGVSGNYVSNRRGPRPNRLKTNVSQLNVPNNPWTRVQK